MIAELGPIRQIAWVTDDIDAEIDHWRNSIGVGPWTIYRNVILEGEYRGRETMITIHVGLAYQGDMQIEIIMPVSTSPSPFRHDSGAIKLGMHHIAWLVDDLETAENAANLRGLKTLYRAQAWDGSSRAAYLQPQEPKAMLIELLEITASVQQSFAQGIIASQSWDGKGDNLVFDIAYM